MARRDEGDGDLADESRSRDERTSRNGEKERSKDETRRDSRTERRREKEQNRRAKNVEMREPEHAGKAHLFIGNAPQQPSALMLVITRT